MEKKGISGLAKLILSSYIVSMLTETHDSSVLLMHDIARLVRYRFDARARDLGVTRQQWRALLTIARKPGHTQSELADFLDVERITLCRMLDRLADSGLVERRPDPGDRRVWRVHVTDAAHEIVDKLATIGAEIERETLSALRPEEVDNLMNYLRRIRDGLGRRSVEEAA